ncbi:MAG: carbohydrate ABC transporter permease [Spirochaetales bacterium]|nr:carbohydrate ABC transporter permease [Spirochaetales bacterium]
MSDVKLKRRKNIYYKESVWIHVLLIITVIIVCFPILFAFIKSTQSTAEVLSPMMHPGTSFFHNIKRALIDYKLGLYMKNSLIISVAVTAGKIVLSFMAAFALVFFKFRGKEILFAFIIITLMLPTEALILGLFDLVANHPAQNIGDFLKWILNPTELLFQPIKYGFGWSQNYLAIIAPFMASATGVFLFRQHFSSIPRLMVDSAIIDGAGPLIFIFHILIPMSKNTIGALALIQFIYVWNQYLWPRVIVRYDVNQVVQVGLNKIIATGDAVYWGEVMAATVIALVPPLIVFGLLYNSFMKGYALSSNK